MTAKLVEIGVTDRVYISPYHYLIKIKGKYIPYRIGLGPIRGYNKNGKEVWRSYKTVEEAKRNLFEEID